MRRIVLASLFALACGEGQLVVETPYEGVAEFRAGLTVGQAGGCSTTIVKGLTTQLVEELNCISPNLMVNFAGPHTNLYSAVEPYLHPTAANALKAATADANDFITLSSAYRSVAQQYLLYKWWRAKECGIQLAAAPGASNHQSGRAIDTPNYSFWRPHLQNRGWRWLGSSDVVHFDYLQAPDTSSRSVLAFQRLWNKNNSNKLAEDGMWGPATEAAMAQSPTTGFAVHGCQTTGKLVGIIFQGGNTANRVSGAIVTAGNETRTTGADGLYEFQLAPGTYTVTVAKSGYSSNQISRAVVAGQTAWGSMEINPVASVGTLRGRVYERNAANPSDQSKPVAGASVSVGGQRRTTDAQGAFDVSLAAGRYAVTVSKPGFTPATASATITAGGVAELSIGLAPSVSPEPPQIRVESPPSGASFDVAGITLVGVAVDDGGPVAEVTVTSNGSSRAVPVVDGSFTIELKLAPGENVVDISAQDGAGLSGAASWRGFFRSGAGGVVRRYDDPAARIQGATLEAVDALSGAVVSTAISGADGAFEIDLRPGSYALTVRADGYVTHRQTLVVGDERREQLDLGLTPGRDAVFSIRFIEPRQDLVYPDRVVNVSGVVEGMQVAHVTANGVEALLFGEGAFLAKVEVPEGKSTIDVVAESPEGHVATAQIEVQRQLSPVEGGCASAPGGGLFGALALLGLIRLAARPRVTAAE